MKEVEELVSKIYASGARLVILDGGLALDGEIPDALKEKVRAHREELLDALMGNPLEGPGWEARKALYSQALRWLDRKVITGGPKGTPRAQAAIDALCQQDVTDPLSAAWCGGDFEEFRAALREYVRAGLHAAKSNVDRCNSNEPAAVTAHQSH